MLYTASNEQLIYHSDYELSERLWGLCDPPAVSMHICTIHMKDTGGGGGGGSRAETPLTNPQKQNLKYTDFVDTMLAKVICD
jgi:hypothetical protein